MHWSSRSLLWALIAGVVLWSAALAATPYALRHGAEGAPLIAGSAVYLFASGICHQRADRSFHPWGVQLPVCGRCAGLYGGALLGVCAAGMSRRRNARPGRTARMVLTAAALPTAATVLLEAGGLADPGNLGRAASAVPLGAAASGFVACVIRGKVH